MSSVWWTIHLDHVVLTTVKVLDHLGSFFPTRGLFSSRGVGCGLPRMSRITPPAF
jgi:hypothetical protein